MLDPDLLSREIGDNPYAPEIPARRRPLTEATRRRADPDNLTLESEYQDTLLRRHAEPLGWRHYHTRNSRGSNPGYPDLTLWHPGHRVVAFRELKRDGEDLSAAQRLTHDTLREAGADVGVWYFPSDWDAAVAWLTDPHAAGVNRPDDATLTRHLRE